MVEEAAEARPARRGRGETGDDGGEREAGVRTECVNGDSEARVRAEGESEARVRAEGESESRGRE